jgi:hypothetical protein
VGTTLRTRGSRSAITRGVGHNQEPGEAPPPNRDDEVAPLTP